MTPYATPWESRRWAVLASILVMAGLSGLIWWLTSNGDAPTPPDAPRPTDANPVLASLDALKDPAVMDLAFAVVRHHVAHGRLPATLEDAGAGRPDGGGPGPTTSRGQPLAYRPTGERTFQLSLPGRDGQAGTADDVLLPYEVPADLPTGLETEALRAWWQLHCLRGAMERLRAALEPRP